MSGEYKVVAKCPRMAGDRVQGILAVRHVFPLDSINAPLISTGLELRVAAMVFPP